MNQFKILNIFKSNSNLEKTQKVKEKLFEYIKILEKREDLHD